MRPISYTRVDNKIIYHYKYSDLKEFLSLWLKDGNVGMILMYEIGDILTYRGFGTIENPFTYILTLSIQHCESFDGRKSTPDERVNPPVSKFTPDNCRMVILDFNNNKEDETNKEE